MRNLYRAAGAAVLAVVLATGAASAAHAASLPGFKCDGKTNHGQLISLGQVVANYTYTPIKVIGGARSGYVYRVDKTTFTPWPVTSSGQVTCFK